MAYKRKTWKNDSSTPLNADGLNDFDKRVGDAVDGLESDLVVIKDYVIDYGENANGKWEKWNSGKLLMWGVMMASENGKDLTQELPLPFIGDTTIALSEMNLQLTANRAGGYNGIFVQGKGFTADKRGFIYRVESEVSVSLVPVHWSFVGKWK